MKVLGVISILLFNPITMIWLFAWLGHHLGFQLSPSPEGPEWWSIPYILTALAGLFGSTFWCVGVGSWVANGRVH